MTQPRNTVRRVTFGTLLVLGICVVGVVLFVPGREVIEVFVRKVLWTRPALSFFLAPDDFLKVELDDGRRYRLVAPGWAALPMAPGGGCLPVRLYPVSGTVALHDDGSWNVNEDFKQLTPRGLLRQVSKDRQDWKLPYVFLTLPGAFGSDGAIGDAVRFPEILHRALDRLKTRYGRKTLCISAESWAGVVLARLIQDRSDIACAIFISTPFARNRDPYYDRLTKAGVYPPYNPIDHLEDIIRHAPKRMIFVSDPQDQVVPFVEEQRPFIEAILKAVPDAQFFAAGGVPPKHHDIPGLATGLLKDQCSTSP
ncbi:MAG: hypothetical protein KatS3mg119_2468 [Rhodothalassiaceae bacterium]|nr:MAG: hypothetical protein KatS3mg119_2468 [Rhodothalassiaceae bacterium]